MQSVYDPPASPSRSANGQTLNADVISPDLVDALLGLTEDIDIRFTNTPEYVDPCGACPEAAPEPDHPVHDAEAAVCHRHIGDTAVYREPVCPEHLTDVVTYEQLRGLPTVVWVEVPR